MQLNGSASDAAFAGYTLQNSDGITVDTSSNILLSNQQFHFGVFTIPARQTRTYTVVGNMAQDLSANAGLLASISLVSVGYGNGVTLNGSLPISGAQQTINSTSNVCYPPQTAVYGYKCWAP
jgi:hypothetical protein